MFQKICTKDRNGYSKGHSNLWFPNCRGIIREPEHVREEPSAVNSFTPESSPEDPGSGKTDTEASESMRNLLELLES